jgi:putative transposase
MRDVCAGFGCELAEFNGAADHIHLVVNFLPTVAIFPLVNSPKGCHPAGCGKSSPDLVRHYWRAKRPWSGSYFAGSVEGPPISVLRQYIE